MYFKYLVHVSGFMPHEDNIEKWKLANYRPPCSETFADKKEAEKYAAERASEGHTVYVAKIESVFKQEKTVLKKVVKGDKTDE